MSFHWIFVAVYVPLFLIIGVCNMGIIAIIVKDIGLTQPYTWFLIIAVIAYIADRHIYGDLK